MSATQVPLKAGNSSLLTPPKPDEVEVSLFGPGYGEAIAIHLGGGEWLLVDSCLADDGATPAHVEYLDALGVPPTAVIQIVATHWHDDHVRGLTETVRRYPMARLAMSQALHAEEFKVVVELVARKGAATNRSVEEMRDLIALLRSRTAKKDPVAIQWAQETRTLWRRQSGVPTAEMMSLSPSDKAFSMAMAEWTDILKRRGAALAVRPRRPNKTAVALWVVVGEQRLLLGADLEEKDNAGCNWSTVLAAPGLPPGKASVHKVAHHGSENGHHPEVWSKMFDASGVSILTPFANGSVRLPELDDVRRILPLAAASAITSTPFRKRARATSGAATKMIKRATKSFRNDRPPVGHVRLRAPASGGVWSRELFGAARELATLLTA